MVSIFQSWMLISSAVAPACARVRAFDANCLTRETVVTCLVEEAQSGLGSSLGFGLEVRKPRSHGAALALTDDRIERETRAEPTGAVGAARTC